jgi:hypothetical protein
LRITSVQIQSTVTPSVREDRAAALEIAQRAAEISHANVVGETADEVDPSSVDASLLADGYATLALGYRYIVGLYPTDSPMTKTRRTRRQIGVVSRTRIRSGGFGGGLFEKISDDRCTPGRELAPGLSNFVPAAARHSDDLISSLDTISRRLMDQILLMA